jgi:hypothetical protein
MSVADSRHQILTSDATRLTGVAPRHPYWIEGSDSPNHSQPNAVVYSRPTMPRRREEGR